MAEPLREDAPFLDVQSALRFAFRSEAEDYPVVPQFLGPCSLDWSFWDRIAQSGMIFALIKELSQTDRDVLRAAYGVGKPGTLVGQKEFAAKMIGNAVVDLMAHPKNRTAFAWDCIRQWSKLDPEHWRWHEKDNENGTPVKRKVLDFRYWGARLKVAERRLYDYRTKYQTAADGLLGHAEDQLAILLINDGITRY